MGEANEGLKDERGPGTFALEGEELERLKNSWWGLEGYLRDAGRHHEPVVTGIVDQGFALLREGMAWSDRNERVPDWGVWMSIAFAQLYNTSMAAWELAYAGYYIQSQMLARLMTEYLAVVWYLPLHPGDAAVWNQKREVPEASTLLKKVFAEDEDVGTQFKQFRQVLHRFSHLDFTGFTILLGEDEDPRTIPIYIGGRFDQPMFQAAARRLLPLFGSIPAAMAKWKRGALPDWEGRVAQWVQRVANVIDEYDRRRDEEAKDGPTGESTETE